VPTKGNPVLHLRLSAAMHDLMMACIERANMWRRQEAYTVATWIETAISEKIAKQQRGLGRKYKRPLRRDEMS
jgi:hypothetical protein